MALYDRINTIYQFIKPFLDNKMSTFEEYRASKSDAAPNYKAMRSA